MSRPLRINYPGALYHVTSRGNAKQDIFLQDQDRRDFLRMLASVTQTYGWICHAYCLMGNHYHLLIETPESNLSSGMRQLNGTYTQRFNRRYSRVGHLLQGRFKAFLIEKESYLLEVARYIVLNPVRAKMVGHPKDWPWSSYRATVGSDPAPRFLRLTNLLARFGSPKTRAQKDYLDFVQAGMGGENPMRPRKHILGSEPFIGHAAALASGMLSEQEMAKESRLIDRPTLEEIFHRIENLSARDKAIIFARDNCGYAVTAIAKQLKLHYSTVSKILNSHPKT